MTRGLFEIDDSGNIVFNAPLYLLYEPFNVIWKYDKSPKKEVAFSILKYIYYMYDYFYYTSLLKGEEKKEKAIKLSKIPKELADSPMVLTAGKYFEGMQEEYYPSIKLYRSLNKGIALTTKAIDVINGNLEKLINSANEFIEDNKLPSVEEIMKRINDLNKIAADFPETMQTLKKLEIELKSNKSEDVTRGGGSIGAFENPD